MVPYVDVGVDCDACIAVFVACVYAARLLGFEG